MLAPMAGGRAARHPPPVFRTSKHFVRQREPDNELYERASELVEAAAAIREAAADPGAAPAVPALLGCIETALRDLASVAGELERRTTAGCNGDRRRERAGRGYQSLRVGLDDAAVAARAAQTLAARTNGR
jgi:hypothetical protein